MSCSGHLKMTRNKNSEKGMECFTCLTDTAHLLDCYINTDLCFHLLSLCSDFRSSSSPLNYPQTMNLQTDNISILYLSRHYLSKLDCVEISLIKEVTSDFSHICVVSCHLSKSSFQGSSCPQQQQLTWTGSKTPSLSREIGGRFSLKFKPLSDVPATVHGSPCW